jgi:hypothetical protein
MYIILLCLILFKDEHCSLLGYVVCSLVHVDHRFRSAYCLYHLGDILREFTRANRIKWDMLIIEIKTCCRKIMTRV